MRLSRGRKNKLAEWPYDTFEMDFSGYTGGGLQPGVDLYSTELYDLSGDPFGYSNGSEISGGQMLPIDYENTYPEIPNVAPANNIQGALPGFLNSINSLLSTFGNAYAKVNAANVQPTQNRLVANRAIPINPAPAQPSFFEQNKGVLLPVGIAAVLFFMAR